MEKFDHLFISITQETGGLQGLLHSIFSFLLRRTDFFVEADPGDNMGFPPGINENMLLKIFNEYRNLHYKSSPPKSREDYKRKYLEYASKNNLPLPDFDNKESNQPSKVEIEGVKSKLESGVEAQKPLKQLSEELGKLEVSKETDKLELKKEGDDIFKNMK